MPFFVDSAIGGKPETVSAPTEKRTASEPSQQVGSEQKSVVNTHEQSSDTTPVQTKSSSKVEEKTRQPVVLNPVPPQQVKQPQEEKAVSVEEVSEKAAQPEVKSDLDVSKEQTAQEPRPITPQPVETGNDTQSNVSERSQSPVDTGSSAVPPSENIKTRFTVKKVEDPVLKSSSPPEAKQENKESEPVKPENKEIESVLPVKTSSIVDKSSHTEVASHKPNKDNSIHPETASVQEPSGEEVSQVKLKERKSLSPVKQDAVDPSTPEHAHSYVQKEENDLPTAAVSDGEPLNMHFEVHASKISSEPLQFDGKNNSRPETPTYGFHPVDSSVSGKPAISNDFKFETQLSGEELTADKQKAESVVSSDDELALSASVEKSGALPSKSEFVQGRFIVSISTDRPETPLSDKLEQVKPTPVQPMEITLQDVTAAVGSVSVPSLTPSSSMESLNSVGSHSGVQTSLAFSSSPQTVIAEGPVLATMAGGSIKDLPRKNSGQSDLIIDAKIVKQDGEQSKQSSEQVHINAK